MNVSLKFVFDFDWIYKSFINRIKIEVYNSKIKLIILGIFQNKKFVLTWTNEKVFILREN